MTFNTVFARPLPANVLAVIKANQVAALTAANGGQVMPSFIDFYRSRPTDPQTPSVICYRRRTKNITQSENGLIEAVAEFAIELPVLGATEDSVMDELEIRVEAVDSMIREAALNDPAALLLNFPAGTQGLVIIEIPEHVYGNNVPQGNKHLRVAALTLTAQLVEG